MLDILLISGIVLLTLCVVDVAKGLIADWDELWRERDA